MANYSKEVIGGFPITFTDETRAALIRDGAFIYLPTGETISGQKNDGRLFWYVDGGFIADGRNRLTEFPARRIEVAIYPDPQRFFVPNSSDQPTGAQIALLAKDTQALRERLGRADIDQILPEAPEVTEVIFRHLDLLGVYLLGPNDNDYIWHMRTNTPTNKEGSRLAYVGYFTAELGLGVDDWGRDAGYGMIGAARWIVPQGAK